MPGGGEEKVLTLLKGFSEMEGHGEKWMHREVTMNGGEKDGGGGRKKWLYK